MRPLKVLYISGSIGLGHVTRDIAIVRELRRQIPNIDIRWLAVPPADLLLKEVGETILPEASELANDNEPAEKSVHGYHLNLLKYIINSKAA